MVCALPTSLPMLYTNISRMIAWSTPHDLDQLIEPCLIGMPLGQVAANALYDRRVSIRLVNNIQNLVLRPFSRQHELKRLLSVNRLDIGLILSEQRDSGRGWCFEGPDGDQAEM